jgi:hypothetical protein
LRRWGKEYNEDEGKDSNFGYLRNGHIVDPLVSKLYTKTRRPYTGLYQFRKDGSRGILGRIWQIVWE